MTRPAERVPVTLLAVLSATASLVYLPVAAVDAWRRRMRATRRSRSAAE